jgi:hypothetical protein
MRKAYAHACWRDPRSCLETRENTGLAHLKSVKTDILAVDCGLIMLSCRRVCAHNNRQCVEFMELSATCDLQGANWRLFFPEPIVSVRIFARVDENKICMLITSSMGVRMMQMPMVNSTTKKSTLAALDQAVEQHPLANAVYTAKEGTQITCVDARMGDRMDIDAFLGTSGGITLHLIITNDGAKTQSKAEYRQIAGGGGGFSLFGKNTAAASGSSQRICGVAVMEAGDVLFTLSEDGKLKRWQLSTGKCLVEKSISMEREQGGQMHTLNAYKLAIMPRTEQLVFALKPSSGNVVHALVACGIDNIADMRPEAEEIDMSAVAERLEILGESGEVRTVTSFTIASLGADGEPPSEAIVSVWQGLEASVVCITTPQPAAGRSQQVSWACEIVHTQSWEVEGQLEVARLYLDKYANVHASEESGVSPTPAYMEDLLFRPRWFSAQSVLAGLSQLLQDMSRHPAQTLPDAQTADIASVRAHVRRTIQDVAIGEGMTGKNECVLWRDLLAACLQVWRREHDMCIGTASLDFSFPHSEGGKCIMLVKRGGLSALRHAEGTEAAFLQLLESEPVAEDTPVSVDHPLYHVSTSILWLSQQLLAWVEDIDPGGAVFSQRMMHEEPEDVLADVLRDAVLRMSQLHPHCDPALIVGKFPEVCM